MRKILIVSPQGGVGKTTTAMNLAVAANLGAADARVLVTDTDPSGGFAPLLSSADQDQAVSLTLNMHGRASQQVRIWRDAIAGLDVLSEPDFLWDAEALAALGEQLDSPEWSQQYHTTIFDSEPFGESSVATLLSFCDQAVVVSPLEALQDGSFPLFLTQLSSFVQTGGARVAGVVLRAPAEGSWNNQLALAQQSLRETLGHIPIVQMLPDDPEISPERPRAMPVARHADSALARAYLTLSIALGLREDSVFSEQAHTGNVPSDQQQLSPQTSLAQPNLAQPSQPERGFSEPSLSGTSQLRRQVFTDSSLDDYDQVAAHPLLGQGWRPGAIEDFQEEELDLRHLPRAIGALAELPSEELTEEGPSASTISESKTHPDGSNEDTELGIVVPEPDSEVLMWLPENDPDGSSAASAEVPLIEIVERATQQPTALTAPSAQLGPLAVDHAVAQQMNLPSNWDFPASSPPPEVGSQTGLVLEGRAPGSSGAPEWLTIVGLGTLAGILGTSVWIPAMVLPLCVGVGTAGTVLLVSEATTRFGTKPTQRNRTTMN